MRMLIVLPAAVVLVTIIFWLMQWMIASENTLAKPNDDVAMVDFIRSLTDSQAEQKNRAPKEPPKPKVPPAMDLPKAQQSSPEEFSLDMPSFESSLKSFKGDVMGSMLAGYGFGNSDVIPLHQPTPRYPANALSRKIEGYVVVELLIDEQGSVEDVKVIDSKPKGIFERETIRAAWRAKFKPKLVDGKPVKQSATLPYEFNVEK